MYKFHLSCSTRPPQLIEMVLKKWHADSFSRDDIDRYVLKVAGREEYLVSDDKMLRQYIVRVECRCAATQSNRIVVTCLLQCHDVIYM